MSRPFFAHQAVFRDRHPLTIESTVITSAAVLTSPAEVILVDSSGGGFALTLPPAAGRRGREFYIVKTQTPGNVTVTAAGADVIGFSGATTVVVNTVDTVVHLISDGATRWIRLQ